MRIDTGSVTFVGNQPWPFPQSTMLGFRATAAAETGALVVDTKELVEASWFDRATVAAATAASGPTGDPHKTEIAAAIDPSLRLLLQPEGVLCGTHTLIQAWLAGR